jgi:hypothetical protein
MREIFVMKDLELIQRMIVRLLATNPAGHGLRLIGGFRYRMLDGSARKSADIDYSWEGDLREKADEIISLFRRKLLPEVKRRVGYDGSAALAQGPAFDSPFVAVVVASFHRIGERQSRMEIPIEITRIVCLDKPVTRTLDGVVYLTASDADMVESKIVSLFNRLYLQERDLIDIFLFKNRIPPDAGERLRQKFEKLSISSSSIRERLSALKKNRDYHSKNIDAVIRDQLEPHAASHIEAAGGGAMVFDDAIGTVESAMERLIAS